MARNRCWLRLTAGSGPGLCPKKNKLLAREGKPAVHSTKHKGVSVHCTKTHTQRQQARFRNAKVRANTNKASNKACTPSFKCHMMPFQYLSLSTTDNTAIRLAWGKLVLNYNNSIRRKMSAEQEENEGKWTRRNQRDTMVKAVNYRKSCGHG
jgi:hypothetical protein